MEKQNPQLREKIIVIIVGGIVTSLVVPLIVFAAETWWATRQERYAAIAARQSSILADQEALLKRVQHELFEYRMKIVKPAWYKYKIIDAKRYDQTLAEFESSSWDFHERMHEELANARRLASSPAYLDLKGLYDRMSQLDLRLAALSQNTSASLEDWERLHLDANEIGERILSIIVQLSLDFNLKPFEADSLSPSAATVVNGS